MCYIHYFDSHFPIFTTGPPVGTGQPTAPGRCLNPFQSPPQESQIHTSNCFRFTLATFIAAVSKIRPSSNSRDQIVHQCGLKGSLVGIIIYQYVYILRHILIVISEYLNRYFESKLKVYSLALGQGPQGYQQTTIIEEFGRSGRAAKYKRQCCIYAT